MFLELSSVLRCRSLLYDVLDVSNSNLLIVAQAVDVPNSVDESTEGSKDTF